MVELAIFRLSIKVHLRKIRFSFVRILIISLFFLSFVACNHSVSNENNHSNEIWPLETGFYWTYALYTYTTTDKNKTSYYDTITSIVGKSIIFNDYEWFFIGPDEDHPTILLTNKEDGIWGAPIHDNYYDLYSATLGYQYPTQIHDKFPLNKPSLETIGLNLTLDTPAGSFDCIKYKEIKDSSKWFYMSPGTGLIKSEYISDIDWNNGNIDTVWRGEVLIKFGKK